MNEQWAASMRERGARLIRFIEYVGLLVVLLATLIAAGQEIYQMILRGLVTIPDLLLLFIYLELITMSAVYWSVGRLPVRMPLYIAMVAMARHLILGTKSADPLTILAEGGTILLLGFAVLVVRYGHIKFPYRDEGKTDVE